jgi:hypothetical protein
VVDATYEGVLSAAGFTADADLAAQLSEHAEAAGMRANGPYEVHGAWSKGAVRVHLEQTTAPDSSGGLKIIVQHPAVLVVAGPTLRVAVNPDDTEALATVLAQIAG